MRITREQSYKLQPQSLILLLTWVKLICPWDPSDGSYDLTHWQKVVKVYTPSKFLITISTLMILLLGMWCTWLCNNLKKQIALLWMFHQRHHQILLFFVNETSPGDNDPEKKDPFDPGPIDTGQEPDLYPSLAPVYAMVAGAHSMEEILQVACKNAAVYISQIQPSSYHQPTSSHFSSNHGEERKPLIGSEQEKFIQRCQR